MQSKLPVAYVEWEDSNTSFGWRKFDPRNDREPAIIRSVGIVVDKSKSSVTLSTSRSSNNNHVDFITIPRSAIRKMKLLKWKSA